VAAVVTVLALGVAEGKLVWYSYHQRDLARSSQGLLLSQRAGLSGRSVFSGRWDRAEMFVIEALIGATHRLTPNVDDFLRNSQPGDFLLWPAEASSPALTLVATVPHHRLYRRVE
jgi:hypothetical protein